MAFTELYTGTETITTAEWSLTTDTAGPDVDTTDGIFVAVLDVSAIAAGDLYRLRGYEKCRSGDTQRVKYEAFIGGPQAAPIWESYGTLLMHGWDFTLTKISGTDRAIHWSIRQVS